jgi:hypothetical protein
MTIHTRQIQLTKMEIKKLKQGLNPEMTSAEIRNVIYLQIKKVSQINGKNTFKNY